MSFVLVEHTISSFSERLSYLKKSMDIAIDFESKIVVNDRILNPYDLLQYIDNLENSIKLVVIDPIQLLPDKDRSLDELLIKIKKNAQKNGRIYIICSGLNRVRKDESDIDLRFIDKPEIFNKIILIKSHNKVLLKKPIVAELKTE